MFSKPSKQHSLMLGGSARWGDARATIFNVYRAQTRAGWRKRAFCKENENFWLFRRPFRAVLVI